MGMMYGASHLRGPFEGLAARTGKDVTVFERAAARDDGSLAGLLTEDQAKQATQERLRALNAGHAMGSDVQAKLLAKKEAWLRERQLEAKTEVDLGPTTLGTRASRELELKREVPVPEEWWS